MINHLIGVWELKEFYNIVNDDQEIQWQGPVHGHLIYTENGFVSVSMNRFKVNENTPNEHRYSFYTGRYKILDSETIEHKVLESPDFNRIGSILTRKFKIEEDGLTLSGLGLTGNVKLKWKKLMDTNQNDV